MQKKENVKTKTITPFKNNHKRNLKENKTKATIIRSSISV